MTNAYFYFARNFYTKNMTLKVSKLAKKFNDRWILRDVSVEVKRGEILGIIGENSSGKSTFLRLIHGSEKSNSGQITFDGKDLTNLSAKERGFSIVADENQTGWKNLFNSSKSNGFSASERHRKNIETTFNTAQSVVLLDNPFFNFSQNSFDEIADILRRKVKEKNLCAILAIENHEQAFAVCDQLAVLHRGEIQQFGTPREIYEKPNSVAVARALGRNNFIEAMRISFTNQSFQEFQTLTGEHRLQTDKSEKRVLGAITTPVTLAIRPEHISISFGASFPEDNLLKAKINDVQYLGATTRLKLDANGLMLEALVLRLVGLNIGDECMVGLPPDRILVLKD